MILADTSAWIEYDRATDSTVDRRVAALIKSDGAIVTTEPVIMEVTAGARTPEAMTSLRALMLRGGLLPFDAAVDFDAATAIYRRCRDAGTTPRGMIDCMIAAVAWRNDATLLCRDVDLERVCTIMQITLDKASTRA